MDQKLTQIGECFNRGKCIVLMRDQYGKFYIYNDGTLTQKRLNATEMGRWFLNAMNEEINEPFKSNQIDDSRLRAESDVFLKHGNKIQAIKFCREHRDWGLKQAMDYLKTSQYY